MTIPQKRAVVAGVLVTILGAAILSAATGAWAQLVKRPEYDLHLQADSAWKRETREILLDVLCAPNVDPLDRRCRGGR
jgi:hypothetical protein